MPTIHGMGLPIKQWLDRFGSGTAYEAGSDAPEDNTPVDAAGLRDMESRVSTAIDDTAADAVAAHAAAVPHLTSGEKAALAGTSGTPGNTNRYVTADGQATALATKANASTLTTFTAEIQAAQAGVKQNQDGSWPARPTIGGQPAPFSVPWQTWPGNTGDPPLAFMAPLSGSLARVYDEFLPVPA